jgi:hypothetical protein
MNLEKTLGRVNSTSLKYHLNRLIFGRRNFKLAATSSAVLYPKSTVVRRPAIFKGSDLSKVIQVQRETSFEHEYSRINGGKKELAATTAFVLKNVVAADGNIYKSNIKYGLRTYPDKIIIDGAFKNYSSACLMSSYMGNKYFGHWMRDDLPKYLAALDIDTPITCLKHQTGHQASYQDILGIKPETYFNGAIKKLTILEDYSQNEHKHQRYRLLRDKVSLNYTKSDKKGVMILRRGSDSVRNLDNEQQVAEFLSLNGFDIVDVASCTVDEIIRKCRVDIVVGVEGSHLGNCIYPINEGGCIVTLQSPSRFNNVYKDYTDCMDMNYGFIIGDKSEKSGFTINLGDLENILNKVENSIHRCHI